MDKEIKKALEVLEYIGKNYEYSNKHQRPNLLNIADEYNIIKKTLERLALESYDKLKSKEIPMKPQIFIQDRGYDIEICPNCKGSIHALKYRHEINGRGNYCDLCGQKLDWGDKND